MAKAAFAAETACEPCSMMIFMLFAAVMSNSENFQQIAF